MAGGNGRMACGRGKEVGKWQEEMANRHSRKVWQESGGRWKRQVLASREVIMGCGGGKNRKGFQLVDSHQG